MINPFRWTLGGPQFWGDVHFFHDWRIQEHVYSQRCRLLDGHNFRHAAGTYEECLEALERIKQQRNLPPMTGEGVLLIHGIVRTSRSMRPLAKQLREDGFSAFVFDYPSTRVQIEKSAEYLHRAIMSLDGIERVHLVGHSMGGLMIRFYLGEYGSQRIGRVVMLGTPNRGARLASWLLNVPVYRWVFGPAGRQLAVGATGVAERLPVPDVPTAVIAGGRGNNRGYNPLLGEDNDGTVEISSTRLEGAAWFRVRSVHLHLPRHREAMRLTSEFLRGERDSCPTEHNCEKPARRLLTETSLPPEQTE